MMFALLLVGSLIPARAQDLANRPNLLLNGSFEEGLAAWPWENGWYESPQGSGKGVSRFEVDETVAHDGKRSARVTGKDNRGVALQTLGVRPEPYRLSGWIRCQGLGEVSASIIIEWLAEGGKWLDSASAGSVKGDADWTFVSAEVTPPAEARVAHVDCLTGANNSGVAWFDDVRLVSAAPGDGTPPPPAAFGVRPALWSKGVVVADWPAYQAPDDIGQFRLYAATVPFTDVTGLEPAASVTGSAKTGRVTGLRPGTTYYVAVVPVDMYGNPDPKVTPQRAAPGDPSAPRLTVTPLVGPTGALSVAVQPPVSGPTPTAYAITTECAGKRRTSNCSASQPLVAIGGLPYDAEVTVRAAVTSPAQSQGVAVAVVRTPSPPPTGRPGRQDLAGVVVAADGQPIAGASVSLQAGDGFAREASTDGQGAFAFGNLGIGAPTAARLVAAAPDYLAAAQDVLVGEGKLQTRLTLTRRDQLQVALWTAPPVAQIFQDDTAPTNVSPAIKLVAGRNEMECYQIVVRSEERLEGVRAVFEELRAKGKRRGLPAAGFAARFVSYVHVDRNSPATPPEELVRRAPADFPDELSDDPERALEPGRTQPIFLSFFVPPGTAPGVYEGHVYLATARGLVAVPVSLEVLPLDFPDQTRLWVVNWFSTDSFENRYGAAPDSPEWWAMLRDYARLFHRYHQNAVTVSPDLCRIWVEADGSRTYDWSRFDRWCEVFLSEGMGRLTVTHLGGRKTGAWEDPEFVLYDRPATNRATGGATTVPVTEFAAALQQHLEEKGWLDLTYQHIADEPIPPNVASWKQQSARVHQAAPNLKRMDAIQVPDLRGFCELWVPQLNYFDQWYADYERWRRAGEFDLWFYVAWVPQGKYPNRLIDGATFKPRIIHWMNYLYDATGYLHWGFNHWGIRFATFSPGDEWMVWPGAAGPNSSLRYEAQRDGLEDCEYLALLEDAQREAIRRLNAGGVDPKARPREIGRRLVRAITDYTRSHAELEAAREEVMREIVATREPPLALVRTEPGTEAPLAKQEVTVWGVTEPGCTVTVNGQAADPDRDRFLSRVRLTPEAPEVTVVIRKGRDEKTLVRRFRVGG